MIQITTILRQLSLRTKLLLIGGIVLLGGGVWYFSSTAGPKTQYQTAQSQKGTLIISVSASGQAAGANTATVTTQATGVVSHIYVANGDTVQAGEKIADITPDQASQQRQAQAYATYLTAVSSAQSSTTGKVSNQAALETAQQAYLNAQYALTAAKQPGASNPTTKTTYTNDDILALQATELSAQSAFDAAQQKYMNSDTSIAAGSSSQTSAWLAYQQALPVVTAPITGTINDISLQEGVIVSTINGTSASNSTGGSSTANATTSQSQTVALINTNGTPQVTVNLSEVDVPNVAIGDRATLTFTAYAGKTFTGKVSSINTAGVVSSGVTTYPTIITLDDATAKIFPNMSATANIITKTDDNVLLVPVAAVQTTNGQSYVRELKQGVVTQIPVTVGDSSTSDTQIISGLSEGESVITSIILPTTAGSTGTSVFSGLTGGRGGGFGGGGVRVGGGAGAARGQ